jgi:DNA-binding NarL/FixJ family response regulator
MKVFIADDSKVVVERLTDLLGEVTGVEIVGRAKNVAEAIHFIQQMRPDAVILDLQMPGGSGLDVLRSIRPSYPNLFILIFTNYPYPQFREQCLAAGANYFLDKSSEFEKIPAIFRGWIKAKTVPASR